MAGARVRRPGRVAAIVEDSNAKAQRCHSSFAPLRLKMEESSDNRTRISYLERLRHLSRPARLYLLHAALLTSSLAISALFFNLAIGALGYPRTFLGLLNTVSIGVAAALSLPLWW